MSLEQIGSLIALALVDSTSFGTLLIPLMLVLATRRVDWPAMSVYLGTVLAFYVLVGVGLLFCLDAARSALDGVVDNRVVRWVQLGLGIGLLVGSFFVDRIGSGRSRRGRLQGAVQRPGAMVALALSATVVEVATMLPYLGAVGIIVTAGQPATFDVVVLFVYCVVMILPALVLLVVAGTIGDRVWTRLSRFGDWTDRQTSGAIGWIVGLVGFFIAADAASVLFNEDDSEPTAMLAWSLVPSFLLT